MMAQAASAPAPVTVSYPQTAVLAGQPQYQQVSTGLSYVPPVANGMYETFAVSAPAMGMMPGMPMGVEAPPPNAPQRLTEGIPDPNAIETQKSAYSKGLDDQLRQGAAILNQQLKQQMDQLHQLGDQQKKKYFVQVDHEIKSQELGLQQQFKEQLLMVQQAAAQQKRILGQQATSLLLEYNQKKAQEDLMFEEYQIAKTAFDSQQRFTQEFSSLQQQQAAATQAAVSQQQAVEQHAAAAMAAIEEQRMQVAQQMAAQSQLVHSAENTAAMATSMYAQAPAAQPQPLYASQQQVMTPMGATMVTQAPVQMPQTVSYTPMPGTTAGMQTYSYTPAPVMQMPAQQAVNMIAAAAPATTYAAAAPVMAAAPVVVA